MTTAPRLLHIGIHDSLNANAGDTLLFKATRDLFERVLGRRCEWSFRQVWEPLGDDEAAALSAEVDAVVVGGGGLLLRDQAGADASISGWQWAAPPSAIRAIDAPLFVLAIGYNRFRGQPDFDPPFAVCMQALADTAVLFSVRNHGSQRAVQRYLRSDSARAVRVLHCPTTVATQLYDLPGPPLDGPIAVNFAYDRLDHRFGADGERGMAALVEKVGRAVTDAGREIRLVAHKSMDLAAAAVLDDHGIAHATVDVSDRPALALLEAYEGASGAIGMRGHGQLVPFGMRIPIASLVSHDKMQWFLDDIGHPEWGVEVDDPTITARLAMLLGRFEERTHHEVVGACQDRLWEVTTRTLREAQAAAGLEPTT